MPSLRRDPRFQKNFEVVAGGGVLCFDSEDPIAQESPLPPPFLCLGIDVLLHAGAMEGWDVVDERQLQSWKGARMVD